MAEAYAKHTNGNAHWHIILIGRNATNAKAIIVSFPKPTSLRAKHEFVSCDATFHREETLEGKEPKLVLIYYPRFKFMRELIPLLQTAKDAGEDARSYITIDYDDLGFLKKGYSFWKLRRQFPAYMDVILQEFAAQNPSLTFIHAYLAGPVRSALADNLKWPLFQILFKILFELLSFPFSYSESGEYMLHAMFTTARHPGTWSVDMYGEILPQGKVVVASEQERRMLWDHSLQESAVSE
ncbi:NAD-P-binding protein [Lentinula detonsa]|uniref:NAD-P-binding protein n=1 Tax=Lentinula detonsa TaxID=2804962 RepID=A0A9W8P813_9AGAR|nr:NAD-P-binding protein [Lentinula detonsa]